MTPTLVVAIVGAVVIPLLLASLVALWKLASRLSAIETLVTYEMNHNGGGSTKDYAKAGRDEAMKATEQATSAKHLAESVDAKVDQLTRAQRDTDRRVCRVSDVVVGMQAVQTYVDAQASGPPGSTRSSTTTTTTNTEGTNA